MRRASAGIALGAALALFMACGQPYLEGSVSVVLDTHYQTSDLTVANDTAVLRFLKPEGSGQDLVFKVSVALSGQTVAPNVHFNLADVLPNGDQRAMLSRNVLNDPITSFPPIQRGDFYLRDNPVSGHGAGGYFTITFVEGIQLESGRTIYGDFSAKVL